MKTTIELSDDLFTAVRIEAARQRRHLKDLVPDLIREGLRAQRGVRETSTVADANVWWASVDRAPALSPSEWTAANPGG